MKISIQQRLEFLNNKWTIQKQLDRHSQAANKHESLGQKLKIVPSFKREKGKNK
jgi:hypothetical protein